jgi:tetratricopeptide (TPR) repeat protein
LVIAPQSFPTKWNQAELLYVQKKFAEARAQFEVLQPKLQGTFADVGRYKIFLCYLFENNRDKAQAQLNKFTQLSATPVYYYANAAWHFSQNHPEQAKELLEQANRRYVPFINAQFADALQEAGWIPRPASLN